MTTDEKYMSIALKEAHKAEMEDEAPIGAVIVKNNKIIAKAHNNREHKNNPLGHAELLAISKASKKLKSWRLDGCTMYVTLEPCIMCGGAIIQSRIEKIVFGAYDLKGGAFGSSINILEAKNINHHPIVLSGIKEQECSSILSNYFKTKRKK